MPCTLAESDKQPVGLILTFRMCHIVFLTHVVSGRGVVRRVFPIHLARVRLWVHLGADPIAHILDVLQISRENLSDYLRFQVFSEEDMSMCTFASR
jgi:hypothetical protein